MSPLGGDVMEVKQVLTHTNMEAPLGVGGS